MKKVIVASGNPGKLKELSAIFQRFGMDVLSKDEAGYDYIDPEENGTTYEENSFIKANEIMKASGIPTIADDSGLEVEYLGGEPGIYSSRFAGEDCNPQRNNEKMLTLLKGVPYEERKARFVTVMTMLYPDGRKIVARGECPGHIIEEYRGEGGFGYDPIFVPEGYDETFAELGKDVKNQISHRAKAIESLINQLESIGQE